MQPQLKSTWASEPMLDLTLKYVQHAEVHKWEALGWISHGPLPHHHGHYSVSMSWPHDTEPAIPPRARK